MLVNLCDYKQSVTLIANSGVQFLDFGLTPQDTASNGRFVRKTANGPLLRPDFDLVNGRYTLPATDGGQPEVVKPESTIPLHNSLNVLDGVWLPLPFLRFNPPRTFVDGPDNWARVRYESFPRPTRLAIRTGSPSRSTARLQRMRRLRCRRLKTISLTARVSRSPGATVRLRVSLTRLD